MDNINSELIELYQKIESIVDQQLDIVQNLDRFENEFEHLLQYDLEKQSYMDSISQIIKNYGERINADQDFSILLQKKVENIRDKTQLLMESISSQYELSSKTMKQVNTHLKTLHSYGGVNNNTSIPYYFDIKK